MKGDTNLSQKTSGLISFILNFLIVLCIFFTLVILIIYALINHYPIVIILKYFTNISNLLLFLASACLLPCELMRARGKDAVPSAALTVFKLAGTAAVSLTLTVVVCYLAPLYGTESQLEGSGIVLHLICPVFAIVSFVFFDGGETLSKKQSRYALIPTLIYLALYFLLTMFLHMWDDFYSFYLYGLWPVFLIILILLSFLIVKVLREQHNRHLLSLSDGKEL